METPNNSDMAGQVLSSLFNPVLVVMTRGREHVSRPGGWCQLRHWTEQRALSAIGACAIDIAVLNIPAQDEVVRYLFDALPWYWRICKWWRRHKTANIVAWFNDRPSRTQEEIIALFGRAIRLRKGHRQLVPLRSRQYAQPKCRNGPAA